MIINVSYGFRLVNGNAAMRKNLDFESFAINFELDWSRIPQHMKISPNETPGTISAASRCSQSISPLSFQMESHVKVGG